jgi:hypothetical protein
MIGFLLPSIIYGKSWLDAKTILQEKYNLNIEEGIGPMDNLFMITYKHGSWVWKNDVSKEIQNVNSRNRGTIYEKNTFKPICIPLFKFWNHYEVLKADSISWSTAKVQDKIDGSLIKLYWYNNDWRVSSNSKINSHLSRDKYKGRSLDSVFSDVAKHINLDFSRLNIKRCYILEFVHPDYCIVVKYTLPNLYHITTRDMNTLQEIKDDDIGLERPKVYNFKSIKEAINAAESKPWYDGEGFVVCDSECNRVKLKSKSYIRIHGQITGIGSPIDKNFAQFCWKVWLHGEESEIVAYFPEYAPALKIVSDSMDIIGGELAKKFKSFIIECECDDTIFFQKVKNIDTKYYKIFLILKSKFGYLKNPSGKDVLSIIKNEKNGNTHKLGKVAQILLVDIVKDKELISIAPKGGWKNQYFSTFGHK